MDGMEEDILSHDFIQLQARACQTSPSVSECSNGKLARMPRVALGTFKLRGSEAVKEAITSAIENGIKHIDTASIYKNEEDIAAALWDNMQLDRTSVFLTSKISPYEMGYDKTKEAIANILRRLRIEYIDMLLIHWPAVAKEAYTSTHHRTKRVESWTALEECFREGKCRAIGVSNFSARHIEELVADSSTTICPMINQIEVHPRLLQTPLRDFCATHGIAIAAYSPFGTGDLLKSERIESVLRECMKLQKQIEDDDDNSCTIESSAQLLLVWGLLKSDCVVAKASSDEHIKELSKGWKCYKGMLERCKVRKNREIVLPGGIVEMLDNMNEEYHYCWNSTEIL